MYCERRERMGEEWLENWYKENGLGNIKIEVGALVILWIERVGKI